jgi:hypothetical protein
MPLDGSTLKTRNNGYVLFTADIVCVTVDRFVDSPLLVCFLQNLLLMVSVIKWLESLYQLPMLKDVVRDSDSLNAVAVTIAVFTGFCWIAPNIAWKNKLS